MKNQETNTVFGLAFLVLLLAFGLVWTFTHSDEVEQLEKQKMDRIINSINQ